MRLRQTELVFITRIAERLHDFQRAGFKVAWVEVGPGVIDALQIEMAHIQTTTTNVRARRVLGKELRENLSLPSGAIEPVQTHDG